MSYLTLLTRMMYRHLYESVDNINPYVIPTCNLLHIDDELGFIPEPGVEKSTLKFWFVRLCRILKLLWSGLPNK